MSAERFDDVSDDPRVRGYLERPDGRPGNGLVLTHGAGGNCEAPLLVALAAAFSASGVTVLRCDLPYRQARPTGPPRTGDAALARSGLHRAVRLLRPLLPGRVFLGGHSYGGRQASMLLAEASEVADALLLLSYPLHPPNRPAQLRTAHFPRLSTPALFVHGSRDPFGSIEELERARALLPGRSALLVADGAGHDLFHGQRSRPAAAGLVRRITDELLAFVGQ